MNLINKGYLCDIKCPEELPFELVEIQECVSNCNINDLLLKLCIIKYDGTEKLIILDLFLDNILEGLESNSLDINILNNNMNITLEYKWITFILTKIKLDEINNILNDDLYQCLYKLRIIYNISNETSLYLLNIQIDNSDNKKLIYEIYYYSNEENILKRMNLSECENNGDIFKFAKCKKYSVQSIINDLCISCDNSNGYYELYNEANNPLKKCYKNIDCTKNEINKYEFKKKCYEKCPEGQRFQKKMNFYVK